MARNASALFLVIAISAIALVAMAGSSRLSGPVLAPVGRSNIHGIHRTDLVVVALWAASMVACWRLWRRD